MTGKWRKLLAIGMSLAMLTAALAGCGGNTSSETPAPSEAPAAQPAAEPAGEETPAPEGDKPYAGTVLTYVVTDSLAGTDETKDLIAMVEEKTGIILDLAIYNKAADGEVNKTMVDLQAGKALDIIQDTTPALKTYYNANVLTNLDEYAAAAGYDIDAVFKNAPVFDGGTYGLPAYQDIWLTYINTGIFKEAGVEIPTADGWTWEKYIETAQKITDAGLTTETGAPVWGSYMLDYDNYNFMYATQKGAEPYKADGTANFDDPLYAESVKWFYSLGNDLKIQPDITNILGGMYAWNQFMAADDMAMFVCGGWVTSMFTNREGYPRDWECAILPMPYPEGSQPSTLAVYSNFAVPATSENKEAAFAAISVMAEGMYELGYGRIPSRVDLTDDEIKQFVETELVPKTFQYDSTIAYEDIYTAWFDPDRTILPEKIIGTASSVILKIWVDECQLYGTKAQDLETTMTKIQERSNAAISDELAS